MAGGVQEMFDLEQEAAASLARGLSAEQWDAPSLCRGWTVREVVTHIAFHIHRNGREALGSSDKQMPRMVAAAGADTIDGLLSWLAAPAPASARKSMINVCELVIHQQDVRRPLGLPREFPESTLRTCLDGCTRVAGNIFVLDRKRRLGRGLRLVATDIPWTKGTGPDVVGTGEAILLSVAGRDAALVDLTGPGADILRERLANEVSSAA